MVQRQAFHFVQWQQNLHQELLVFRLQRQGKAIDNAEITTIHYLTTKQDPNDTHPTVQTSKIFKRKAV
jgi:hypothetical protein